MFQELKTSPEQLSFAKFKDIAIPDGAVMDMENTVIFGSDDEWFGRLAINPQVKSCRNL